MERLRIVLGLGNPGQRYRHTRHNLGFRVLDGLAGQAGAVFRESREFGGDVSTAELVLPAGPLVLAKPLTYMNRSGWAAAALCLGLDAVPGELLVVHDDADLDLGRIRIRRSGGAGGHNGLRSMIELLGTEEFPRIKLGVRGNGRAGLPLADYVLAPFEPEERAIVDALVDLGIKAVHEVREQGLAAAMNACNGRLAVPGGRC